MKFAVVEYSSKSGKAWQHTDARPNYLCDPVTEIDPTSFGCYVSALKGEHIPLNGLITGPVNQVSSLAHFYRKATKRLTRKWPSYSLNYLQTFDVILFVHQLSETKEINRALARLRKLTPRPLVFGVPTQPFGILNKAFAETNDSLHDFQDFASLCDVFISIVASTVPFYQAHTTTPVVYFPQPYPAAFASRHFTPFSRKEKTILVAGVTQRYNIVQGQTVAKKLQEIYPDHLILIPKVADLDYDYTALADSRYQVLPFEHWQDHLKTLAKTKLVINTDYTATRGRIQADCAAVGTPSVGSNSDAQQDLFPNQFAEPNATVDDLVTQSRQLLDNEEYYTQVALSAKDKLAEYDYGITAQRFTELVKKYRHD